MRASRVTSLQLVVFCLPIFLSLFLPAAYGQLADIALTSKSVTPTTLLGGGSVSGSIGGNWWTEPGSEGALWYAVVGFRNSSGLWVGGDAVAVSGMQGVTLALYPGQSFSSKGFSSLTAPTAAGTYTVWIQMVPVTSLNGAIDAFKTQTATTERQYHKQVGNVTVGPQAGRIRLEPLSLSFSGLGLPSAGGAVPLIDEPPQPPHQSTTGPVPPPEVMAPPTAVPEQQQGGATKTMSVPSYMWRHGCGPTAVGMVLGYYDMHACDYLYAGNAAMQTDQVNQGIASQGGTGSPRHYEDYSLPMDSGTPTIQADKSEQPVGSRHPNDSVADFMRTSWSAAGNRYGWSWSSDIGPAFTGYVNLRNPIYMPACRQYYMGGSLTWAVLKQQIDNDRPMVFLVDSDGDGYTDHFVTIVGYNDTPVQQYGCLDTWYTPVRWCTFRGMSNTYAWGVWGGWSFSIQPPIAAQSFMICNDGDAALTVTSISRQGGSAWLTSTPAAPFDLASHSSKFVTVSVDPSNLTPGSYADRLVVESSDSTNSPYPGGVNVNLTANGSILKLMSITQPPVGQTAYEGNNATLSVLATGAGTLTYRWQRDGVDLLVSGHYSGVTTASLTIFAATAYDSGNYRCVVSGDGGSVTSSEAALLVTKVGDINGDGHVNVIDLLTLADSWSLSVGHAGFLPACDLNTDGIVDIVDLLYMANNWGR